MSYVRCNLVQGSSEWHEWRANGIGSSEISVLLDINPYQTLWDVWAIRFGIKNQNLDKNPNVKNGKRLEASVRDKLSVHFKQGIEVFCAYMERSPHRRISLDGVINGNTPVEIKVLSNPVWESLNKYGERSEAYELYYPQLCYQMGVLNSMEGYLAFYNETENRIKLFKVKKIEAVDIFIDEIFASVDKFFVQNILAKLEPEKDPLRDDYIPDESEMHECNAQALKFYELVIQERNAKKIYEDIKSKRESVSCVLLNIASTFKSLNLFGIRITNRKRSYRVNYEEFLSDKGIVMTEDEMAKYSSLSKVSTSISTVEHSVPQLKDKVLRAKAIEANFALKN